MNQNDNSCRYRRQLTWKTAYIIELIISSAALFLISMAIFFTLMQGAGGPYY